MNKPFRLAAALLFITIVSVSLAACGSGDTNSVVSQDTEATSTVVVETTDPAETTELAKLEETSISAPAPAETTAEVVAEMSDETTADSNEMANVAVEPVEDSATTEVVQARPASEPGEVIEAAESALLTSYADYGFSLKFDLGAEIQAAGWTEPDPSLTQGIIAFAYGGVNANIVWGPPEERTALTFLADTYNILRASQPTITFESISDGDISIAEQEGVYGGFKAVDDSGSSLGGGLIGAWICPDSDTAFRMTLTGEDATVVQLRFDRLLENFACSTS